MGKKKGNKGKGGGGDAPAPAAQVTQPDQPSSSQGQGRGKGERVETGGGDAAGFVQPTSSPGEGNGQGRKEMGGGDGPGRRRPPTQDKQKSRAAPEQQQGQGERQQQQGQSAHQQEQGQGARQQQQQGRGARQQQQGKGAYQQQQGQGVGPQQQQHSQGAWQSGVRQQQQSQGAQRSGGPEQQFQGQQQAQGAWQPAGRQQQQQTQAPQRSGGPQQYQPPQQQQSQGAWQPGGRQQQQQQQQTQAPQRSGGPQQYQPPQQQQSQGAWQPGGRQQQQTQAPQRSGGPQQHQPPPQQQTQGAWHPGGRPQQQTQGGQQSGSPQQQQSQGAWQSGVRPQQQLQTLQPSGGLQQPQSGYRTQGGKGQPQGQIPEQPGPKAAWQDSRRGSSESSTSQGSSIQGQRLSPSSVSKHSIPATPKSDGGKGDGGKGDRFSILSLEQQMKEMSIIPKISNTPGTRGRKIPIETNYLRLNLGTLKEAYHFDVDINPDTPKKFLRQVVEEFRRRHFPKFHPAFDGRKNLYSPHMLVYEGSPINDEIIIKDGDREKTFKVQVQFANVVDLTPLHQVRMTSLSPQEAMQLVEIVLRMPPSSRCIQAGRSFFTRPPGIIDLGEGMEMYQGFYQSVVRGWKPFLNIDVAHKAFPKETDVITLIAELCSTFRERLTAQDLRNYELQKYQEEIVKKFLKTLRIVYQIPGQPGSKREYRVNGIAECPRKKKFRPENGQEITIEEYFARKKNHRLSYPLMPTIWVGNVQRPDPILLPAELCTVVPGQPVNRKMTENQTSAMIKHAATPTYVRKEKIMTSLRDTKHNQDMCIREFGFSIGDGFEKIEARVLDPPTLQYDRNLIITPSKGVWRQDNATFLKGAEIHSWTIISTCGPMEDNLRKLADMIVNFGPKCGMSFNSRAAQPFEIVRGRVPNFRDIEACLRNCHSKKYDMVFVVIPDSGPTYSDVKRAAELNIGCLTQCIKRKTLNKLNPATVNNILLKVNSKLNGTNHCLGRRPPILSIPCMIMGADVTHPSPDSQNIPSVAAVTASHDPKAFCYNICCRLQSPKTEIITDLENIVMEQLNYFYQMNRGQKPQRIVFFRDGVSEGQFIQVIRHEIAAIRRACKRVQADGYEPKITFLVVQKRHHTRFFPIRKQDSDDRNFNVPAGTCVDREITNPNMQDFYLVSHASIQGVAKPTKYCTLWDDNNMNNDEIEELTYHLCHLFTRCNRSVSYPAPTYYAHLAAARAKAYIESTPLDLNNLDNEQRKISILDIIRKSKPMFFV